MPDNLNRISQETRFRLLRQLADKPDVSQREIARFLGVSLGKANYCLNALIEKGLVKAENFRNSKKKRAYLYKLTPKGIELKTRISITFLKRKIQEYEVLEQEIKELQDELKNSAEPHES